MKLSKIHEIDHKAGRQVINARVKTMAKTDRVVFHLVKDKAYC